MSSTIQIEFRGDTVDFAVNMAGADFTNATIRATLKIKLTDATNDSGAAWASSTLDCNDPLVCDDPTQGIAYISIPHASTYLIVPSKIYYVDAEVTFPDGRRKTAQARVRFKRDGTRGSGE